MLKYLYGIFYFFFISFLLAGCSSFELTKYADKRECTTTIEGNYYKETAAKCDYPAIFLKMSRQPKLVEGKLLARDSSGVFFDPENIGFHNPEPFLYSYDTLYGALDERGKLYFGNIPEFYAIDQRLVIRIEKQGKDKKTISELVLQPNEPFAYCIEPGEYIVTQLVFIDTKHEVQHIGKDIPQIKFKIEEGKANYLGNIYADYKTKDDQNVIVVPCSNYDSEASAGAGMFGLIGSLAYAVANEVDNAGLHHVIHLELDRKFLPEANREKTEINLEITAP